MSATAAEIRRDIAKMIRPPERISVVEAANRYVNVRTASGGVDKWDKTLTPYMVEPMNCLTSRNFSAEIFIGPAQSGKTQGVVTNFMGYVIKCDPADFMIMQTTKGTARDFDTQVIKRAFRDSPELKMELAPGSKSDNTYDKVFRSGAILFQRWPSINELSGKPLKYVLITDYDRMTQNIDGEGSPFSLGSQRTAKFLSRGMTVVETSPGFEITDPKHKTNFAHEAPPCGGALSLFNMGDMRRWYVQCPECGEYYMPPPDEKGLDFVHERDLFGATLTEITRPVKFICTKNGCLIDVSHKKDMNQTGLWVPQGCTIENGKVIGEPIKSSIASFWFPGIFAAYSNPEALVEKYLKGHREYDITGSEQNLKTTVNVNFGAAYLPRNLAELEAHAGLSDRAEPLERYYVPDSTRVLIASVDIQNGKDSRFVVEVHAIGVGLEQTIVDRFEIAFVEKDGVKRRINPGSNIEDWNPLIDRVISTSYKTHNGRKMMVHLTAIDTGGEGDTTHNAYQFYRKLKKMGLSSKVILVKGGSGKNEAPIIRSFGKDQNKREMKDVPLYLLATDFFKDIVASILRRTIPGGMYLHFPKWLSEDYYDEIQAEVRQDNGKWVPIRKRNESLDLNVYILACCWYLGINSEKFDWQNPPSWAAPLEANGNVFDRDTKAPAPISSGISLSGWGRK
jgi:phage terminase large subunit GpA-like protein